MMNRLNQLKQHITDEGPRFWIALLRIMIGLLFLTVTYSNIEHGFYSAEGLHRFFNEVFPQSANPLRFYAAFIERVILPVAGPFSTFQAIAEPLMGLAFVFGVFTPLAVVGGIVFIANTFLATFGHDWPWSYIMMCAIMFTVAVTQSGRTLGVDGWLARRFGSHRWYLW